MDPARNMVFQSEVKTDDRGANGKHRKTKCLIFVEFDNRRGLDNPLRVCFSGDLKSDRGSGRSLELGKNYFENKNTETPSRIRFVDGLSGIGPGSPVD